MQDKTAVSRMGILVEVVNPVGIDERTAPLDPMHLIPLAKKEFG
jgi:hypothetical protein